MPRYLGHHLLGEKTSLVFTDEQYICSSTVCGCLLAHAVRLRQFDAAMNVTKLHGRFPFGCLGCETAVPCLVPILVPVPRRPTYFGRHLVGRGCGMTRSCVLGANARFQFETWYHWYDGKGTGLMRLAGHMPMVGEREAICNAPRLRPAGGSQNT